MFFEGQLNYCYGTVVQENIHHIVYLYRFCAVVRKEAFSFSKMSFISAILERNEPNSAGDVRCDFASRQDYYFEIVSTTQYVKHMLKSAT